MHDRRTAIKVLGVAAAAFPILGQTYTAKVFDAGQLALLVELTDRIIPRTDTPGAADAGVPLLIDRIASRRPEAAQQWKELLVWFANEGNSAEERYNVLNAISHESGTIGARYFKLLKDTTIDQYYSTKEGLQQELGWVGNTYLPDFPGCTHPEHQISDKG